jgi:hypothetical protein
VAGTDACTPGESNANETRTGRKKSEEGESVPERDISRSLANYKHKSLYSNYHGRVGVQGQQTVYGDVHYRMYVLQSMTTAGSWK